MSKNNSLTTLRKSGASATQTSLRGVHYLEKPKELTNIEDITTELVEDNQRRLNDVGGGIGRFLNWFFSGNKNKSEQKRSKAPQKTFYEKLDEEIAAKPRKSEFHIYKKDSYVAIPSPRIFDSRINAAEKSAVELSRPRNPSSSQLETEQLNYENFLQRGLEKLYFYLKLREVSGITADSLGISYAQKNKFIKKLTEAKTDLEMASNLNKTSALPLFYQGIFHLFGEEQITIAHNFFKKALEFDPNMPWAHHFFALTLGDRQRKVARKYFEIELEKNRNPQSLQQLAQIDLREEEYDRALSKLEEAIGLDPQARMAHLKISQIYQHQNNAKKEFEHLNKELENAHFHRDQKFANRVSRDLGYYNIKHNNPHEALRLFDYVRAHKMLHERHSTTHLFDIAYAEAMIDGAEKAEQKLLKITREQFIKCGTQDSSTTAPVYFGSFKLLAEFRIKQFGFEKARENLEEELKKTEQISNPTTKESQLTLSIKSELATLIYVRAKSLKNEAKKSELLEQSKQLIEEESGQNRSHQSIKNALERLVVKAGSQKHPNTSTQNSSHQKLNTTHNASKTLNSR